ncbi:MAG TPA: hypothetical protein VMG10_30775 [Gemmataceae bacterium]|nr:hypothetical protein [Gemmataceae bacterium]
MPTKEQDKQHAEQTKRTNEQRSGVIVGQLVQALGRPAGLYRVEVRHLWDNHFRANVFVGTTVTSTRIAHSFFLKADEDGNIVASIPDISRVY